jgi:hypothetical protein
MSYVNAEPKPSYYELSEEELDIVSGGIFGAISGMINRVSGGSGAKPISEITISKVFDEASTGL